MVREGFLEEVLPALPWRVSVRLRTPRRLGLAWKPGISGHTGSASRSYGSIPLMFAQHVGLCMWVPVRTPSAGVFPLRP